MAHMSLEQWYRYLESQFESESQSATEPKQEASPAEPEAPSQETPKGEAPDPVVESASSRATPVPTQPVAPTPQTPPAPPPAQISIRVPHILEFLPMLRPEGEPLPEAVVQMDTPETAAEPPSEGPRLRKRKRRPKVDPNEIVPPEIDEIWAKLPRYLRYLAEWTDDSVTRKYYPARIRESREELIARLTDPVLTLEETARLLGVCPATIRRYTDRGWLRHFRTEGNQRRFRLSDIVAFLEEQANRRPLGNRNASKEESSNEP
ncbi:MAG: helix-turn-helix domain-containing protein [Fimbriimonadales bacterium]|jgi:excisionase family DNA binding protein|nr:hypothetical protein HRbin14_02051 [bacterium HR14]CUU36691.1 DNA binding domain-containing protein, excisionase family [Armatimonadetes bacterium GXS]